MRSFRDMGSGGVRRGLTAGGAGASRDAEDDCGGRRAFDLFVDDIRPRLVLFAEMMCGREADAESVAQEALLRAYSVARRDGVEALSPALFFKITRNEALRALGGRKTSRLDDAFAAAPDDEPDSVAIRKERIELLRGAVGRLPRLQRDSILLTRYGGLSCAEAARALGTSGGAVQTAVYKGLITLRKLLLEGKDYEVLRD